MEQQNCENCGKRIATVHLTNIEDGETKEVNLCSECAAEQGVMAPAPAGIELLQGLITQQIGQELAHMAALACPQCGHTFLAFRTQGRLGCPRDYEVFQEALTPLIERMHGATEHVGKAPAGAGESARLRGELAALRRQLKQAIDREDFERAAALRDDITRKEHTIEP